MTTSPDENTLVSLENGDFCREIVSKSQLQSVQNISIDTDGSVDVTSNGTVALKSMPQNGDVAESSAVGMSGSSGAPSRVTMPAVVVAPPKVGLLPIPSKKSIECGSCSIRRPTTASHCYDCGLCIDEIGTVLLADLLLIKLYLVCKSEFSKHFHFLFHVLIAGMGLFCYRFSDA